MCASFPNTSASASYSYVYVYFFFGLNSMSASETLFLNSLSFLHHAFSLSFLVEQGLSVFPGTFLRQRRHRYTFLPTSQGSVEGEQHDGA